MGKTPLQAELLEEAVLVEEDSLVQIHLKERVVLSEASKKPILSQINKRQLLGCRLELGLAKEPKVVADFSELKARLKVWEVKARWALTTTPVGVSLETRTRQILV